MRIYNVANVGAGTTPTYHATESVEEARAVVAMVDGCETANERLQALLYSTESRDEICERLVMVEALAAELYSWIESDYPPPVVETFASKLRDLGIEVVS